MSDQSQSDRVMCRVKWFNNKSGFGFATTLTDNQDVFVHHTAVKVSKEQYRYLVQGEYIEVGLEELTEGNHKWQAVNITGIQGGPLMCETRQQQRDDNEQHKNNTKSSSSGKSTSAAKE